MIEKVTNYNQLLSDDEQVKLKSRLNELVETANAFIEEAGYSEYVRCDEKIMLNGLSDVRHCSL